MNDDVELIHVQPSIPRPIHLISLNRIIYIYKKKGDEFTLCKLQKNKSRLLLQSTVTPKALL